MCSKILIPQSNRDYVSTIPLYLTQRLEAGGSIDPEPPQTTEIINGPLKIASPATPEFPLFFKCKDCAFLTLLRQRYEEHPEPGQEHHLLNCPGCTNTFRSRLSLESHLLHDHRVEPNEIPDMLNLIDPPPQQTAKSRIYIKSVDVLRNPSFADRNTGHAEADQFLAQPTKSTSPVMPVDLVDLCDLTQVNVIVGSGQRQKIYLKNVNELQQQQTTNLFPSEFDQFQAMPFQSPIPFAMPLPLLTPVPVASTTPTDTGLGELPAIVFNAATIAQSPDQEQPLQEAPKNKIYIRNVQTLIRPDVHDLGATTSPPQTPSSYLHLQPLDELEEEVQSLPPQRNDIVVLDDFHETLPPSRELTPQGAFVASEALKEIAGCQSLSAVEQQLSSGNAHQFAGMFSTTTDCDESSFYYKSLEENLPQLILATSHHEATTPEQHARDATPPPAHHEMVVLVPPKNDEDLHTPPRIDCESPTEHVICLPDESDGDEGSPSQAIALPQMPRIYVSSNLSAPSTATLTNPTAAAAAEERPRRVRGRPKGGRNYAKESYPHSCAEAECGRRFREESSLTYHMRCHGAQGKEAIVCPECQRTDFPSWNQLHSHLWREHAVDMELYSCTLCAFKTPCLSTLNNTHLRTHSTAKDFKCHLCASSFKNQKQLKNHVRRHRISATAKPTKKLAKSEQAKGHRHSCAQCGLVFEKRVLLQRHTLQAHSNGTGRVDGDARESGPWHCDQCPYLTVNRNNAVRHRMIHNGELRYKCPDCDYACIQSSSFRVSVVCGCDDEIGELNCPFVTLCFPAVAPGPKAPRTGGRPHTQVSRVSLHHDQQGPAESPPPEQTRPSAHRG